ncbi:MAG TPA: hypothetical protein P5186_13185 [Candidatus Paceibacterota bacterium]|nr:hypothetical protein [Verrucomicrobiota bacterium]HRY48995.1 hypothetical protein [Candidatus Paceibacterota bacterium]
MIIPSFTDPILRSLPKPVTFLAGFTMLWLASPSRAEPISLRISETAPGRAEVVSGGRTFLTSPAEGLWSVATNWTDGWPSGWVHTRPEKVEQSGDWTIVSGKLALHGGWMEVRDAYRLDHDLVRGVRRWTWTGK